jgi:hypothetical protein
MRLQLGRASTIASEARFSTAQVISTIAITVSREALALVFQASRACGPEMIDPMLLLGDQT